jgi:hypothetical protein
MMNPLKALSVMLFDSRNLQLSKCAGTNHTIQDHGRGQRYS